MKAKDQRKKNEKSTLQKWRLTLSIPTCTNGEKRERTEKSQRNNGPNFSKAIKK